MKLATVTLKMNRVGSTIIKKNVTPAELLLLVAMHGPEAGGDPVIEVKETGETSADFPDHAEVGRLKQIYSTKKVEALFPGPMARLPETFEEARQVGAGAKLPSEKFMEFQVA